MAANIQLNMTRGELTPYLHARVDLDHYRAGLGYMRNWIPLRFGGMTRLPGTLYQGPAKIADRTARFIPFLFNRSQSYAIEAGHLYLRFWNMSGRVESPPGTPVEVTTPYAEDDLKYLQLRQSGDIIYLVCFGYAPRTLTRNSETSWSLDLLVTEDGPYLDINVTAVTIDPSAASGSGNLTLSNISAVNGGVGWLTSDIGRLVRLQNTNGNWYIWRITARTSATVAVATFLGQPDGTLTAMPDHNSTTAWRISAWSVYDGYPSAVGFYEDRLILGGSLRDPTRMWGSVPSDYDSFTTSAPLVGDDAFNVRLTGGQLNGVQWIADGKDILIGTEGSLRALGRNNENEAFGPLNIRQRPETSVSTAYLPGFFIENVLLFLDVYRAKLYETVYANDQQGYVSNELSGRNEHLLGYGVTSIAYQAAPNRVIWMTTDNGLLLAAVYDSFQEVFGVSQCDLGEGAFVEHVMSLPGTTSDGDQVWLIVRRTVNGSVVRYVETLSAFFRQGYSEQPYPVYGHCAGVYTGEPTDTVTGLDYIEGETVGVWADGVDLGDAVIEEGELAVPLNTGAETIVWGIRYSSNAQTLRLTDYGTGESGLGRPLIVSNGYIDLYQTVDLRTGMGALTQEDYDTKLYRLRWADDNEQNPYEASSLRTGSAPFITDDKWDNGGVFTMETNSMHPATVRAVTLLPEGED